MHQHIQVWEVGSTTSFLMAEYHGMIVPSHQSLIIWF